MSIRLLGSSTIAATFLLAIAPITGGAQQRVELAPNAPSDKPVFATYQCQVRAMFSAMEPYVAQARATYPGARDRFLAGLPARHTMFVTTRLTDSTGRIEQVFVAVDSIRANMIAGRIWSEIMVVSGYHLYQPYSFSDSLLVDWMVARPDGSEEGNVVGKFLDGYRPPATCTDSGAAH